MVRFDVLEPLIYVTEGERTVVGLKDRSTGFYHCALFHESEPCTLHGELVGYTYYGFMTYTSVPINDISEMVYLVQLFAENMSNKNYWWEDDSHVDYPEHLRKLAEFLNEEMDNDEEDEFMEELIDTYMKPKKPKLTLIKNEEENDTED